VNGLQYIHHLNIVHGDIKSVRTRSCLYSSYSHTLLIAQANILVDAQLTARVTDFGIAKVLYLSPTAATTLCGGPQGTYRQVASSAAATRNTESRSEGGWHLS
jgi:serine/threonine protein kinase